MWDGRLSSAYDACEAEWSDVASADTENASGSFPLSEERMSRKWRSLPSPFLSQTGSSEKGGA